MTNFILLVVIIFLITIAVMAVYELAQKRTSLTETFRNIYYKKEYLLTKSEHQFFDFLQQIVKDKYYVFPQIHLASILEVKSAEKHNRTWFNKIIGKSVDFVICDRQYLKPLLVVELDDNSHYRWYRQERDQFVNQAIESVGLKFVRVKAAYSYDVPELSHKILENLI